MPAHQSLTKSIRDRVTIDLQIDPVSNELALADLQQGLNETPLRIPTRYLYDRRGSELFEKITQLEEYYLTRAERTILVDQADRIQEITECRELLELGAGAATKTRLLLDAMQAAGQLELYIPLDVSESEVRRVAEELVDEYDELRVHGIVADFIHHLTAVPPGKDRLLLLLGSTIGNFTTEDGVAFLRRINQRMTACDYFLLGADLIKEVSRIEAAYNDRLGITAEFNRNILRVVNRFADADFEPEKFEHLAYFNHDRHRVEMHLIAQEAMTISVRALDLTLDLEVGEDLFTEISCKYDRSLIKSMLERAEFELAEWFTDPEGLFALALARKRC